LDSDEEEIDATPSKQPERSMKGIPPKRLIEEMNILPITG